jgi:hypothetical protein
VNFDALLCYWFNLTLLRHLEGITRELFALLGERAPPIAVNENRYKGRPKWLTKARAKSWYAK